MYQNRFRLPATFIFCLFSSTACGGGGAGSDATGASSPAVSATPSPAPSPAPAPSATPAPSPTPAPSATPAPSPAPAADATQARFHEPEGIAVSGNGDVYVVDAQNYTIRKIATDGTVTTVAGAPGQSGSADGTGSAARFTRPHDIAVDRKANLYVTDGNTIRKITSAGAVTTIAGTQGQYGNADGVGAAARFHSPQGIVVDASGNLFVADQGDLALDIRKITPSGSVTTLAGNSDITGVVLPHDGTGADARFIGPTGLAIDASGNLYVTDIGMGGLTVGNNYDGSTFIRKVTPGGTVTTIAGNLGVGTQNNVETVTQLYGSSGIALDGAGNIYVTDHLDNGNRIKKVDPSGSISVFATSGAGFGNLTDLEMGPGGTFYASDAAKDTIDKISSSGNVAVYAGKMGQAGSADTP